MCNPITATAAKPFFNKDVTNIIKGIALILMFVHHFFAFPDRWCTGIYYPTIAHYSAILALSTRICVPIFCFLTGYFYFFAQHKTMRYSIRKITDILIIYWLVFFLLAITAKYSVGYPYTIKNILTEMFALNHLPTMLHAWYVRFYYSFMLFMPLIAKTMKKNIHTNLLFFLFLIPFLLHFFIVHCSITILNIFLNDLLFWFSDVLIGYLFAQHELFSKLQKINDSFCSNKILCLLLWLISACLLPFGRYFLPGMTIAFPPIPMLHKSLVLGISMDVIYTPLFIYCIVRLFENIKLKYLRIVLVQIGKYSLLMWFLHCIFHSNSKEVFQPILYWPHNPILVTAWGLLLSYLCAIPLDMIAKRLIALKNKILMLNDGKSFSPR